MRVSDNTTLAQTEHRRDINWRCMDYYQCSIEALHQELQRRIQSTNGSHDQLSERLRSDDEERKSEATTVKTEITTTEALHEVFTTRQGECVPMFSAEQLVNQKIVFWDLNTFFPALQLFFESGLSCKIDGDQLPDAIVGLDPILRFRLTDCTHEEQGRVIKGTLSTKFAHWHTGITILEAVTAKRTSTRVKPVTTPTSPLHNSSAQLQDIVQEGHMVVGLRLSGMSEMGYIWSKAQMPSRLAAGRIWGDVRLAGLRDDVPAPILGLAADFTNAEGKVKAVEKNSMISLPGGLDEFGRPWI